VAEAILRVIAFFCDEAGILWGEYLALQHWAFGGTGFNMKCSNSLDSWNSLHGNLFKIKGTDNALETFKKIVDEFKRWREK